VPGTPAGSTPLRIVTHRPGSGGDPVRTGNRNSDSSVAPTHKREGVDLCGTVLRHNRAVASPWSSKKRKTFNRFAVCECRRFDLRDGPSAEVNARDQNLHKRPRRSAYQRQRALPARIRQLSSDTRGAAARERATQSEVQGNHRVLGDVPGNRAAQATAERKLRPARLVRVSRQPRSRRR